MDAKIKTWMTNIFPKPGDIFKIKNLGDIFSSADKFSSTENIFLILLQMELISSHKNQIDRFKEELQSGLPCKIYTDITFHITDKGILLLKGITDEPIIDNQLKLDL